MQQVATLDAVIGWLLLAAGRNKPLACGRVYITWMELAAMTTF